MQKILHWRLATLNKLYFPHGDTQVTEVFFCSPSAVLAVRQYYREAGPVCEHHDMMFIEGESDWYLY
jgi:hypothetical protein